MRVALKTLTMMAACTAVLLPLSAAARGNPHGSHTGPPFLQDVDCAVLGLPNQVFAGETIDITIVRKPRYPGQWISPTITTVIYVNDAVEDSLPPVTLQGFVTSNRYKQSITIPDADAGSVVVVDVTVEEEAHFAECDAMAEIL